MHQYSVHVTSVIPQTSTNGNVCKGAAQTSIFEHSTEHHIFYIQHMSIMAVHSYF